jgi:hypothetical protein
VLSECANYIGGIDLLANRARGSQRDRWNLVATIFFELLRL